MTRTTLRFFAAARAAVGRDEQVVDVPDGESATIGRLLTEVRPVEGTSAADWRDVLLRNHSRALEAPSWLWSSVVELVASHERGYLDHCRRHALDVATA